MGCLQASSPKAELPHTAQRQQMDRQFAIVPVSFQNSVQEISPLEDVLPNKFNQVQVALHVEVNRAGGNTLAIQQLAVSPSILNMPSIQYSHSSSSKSQSCNDQNCKSEENNSNIIRNDQVKGIIQNGCKNRSLEGVLDSLSYSSQKAKERQQQMNDAELEPPARIEPTKSYTIDPENGGIVDPRLSCEGSLFISNSQLIVSDAHKFNFSKAAGTIEEQQAQAARYNYEQSIILVATHRKKSDAQKPNK